MTTTLERKLRHHTGTLDAAQRYSRRTANVRHRIRVERMFEDERPSMTSRKHPRRSPTTATVSPSRQPQDRPRYLLATIGDGVQIRSLPASGSVLIGRDAECQVVLDDPTVSRQHARLEIGATSTITDLGSRNGTLLRRGRLTPGEAHEVSLRESFTIGSVSILLVPPGASPPIAAVAASRLLIPDPKGDDPSGLLTGVAQSNASVLIFGETGVGKELLSSRIHALSGRKGPFVAINCAALTETLLESELFGHEKGAFTGATHAKDGLLRSSAGGTLLLDEIGEMSLAVQAKLLRAIETQSVLRVGGVRSLAIDVRFLGATHRDLAAAIDANAFRRDLYHRLAGFSLAIPPLRERKSEIVRLATEILTEVATSSGVPTPSITPAATLHLSAHHWPGNIRELRNVLNRARVLARGSTIDVTHILFDSPSPSPSPAPAPATTTGDERARIIAALEACAGNQTRAARLLGISRRYLVQKLRALAIPRPRSPR
jgi:transcriptional regulator with AAA-type ATPase domain